VRSTRSPLSVDAEIVDEDVVQQRPPVSLRVALVDDDVLVRVALGVEDGLHLQGRLAEIV
jgi:hypothetical protein